MVMPCSFGLQAVGHSKGQSAARRAALQGVELVSEDGLAVEQQAADQGGLAVVNRARRSGISRLASEVAPFLRFSMEASDVRSSIRVAPFADGDGQVSATTSMALRAGLSTGQVQVMSPTVRKRTSTVSTVSPSSGGSHRSAARAGPCGA